jgi:hypothetical protein
LRSLQEIQPGFEEEAKAYAGLWSQGKKKIFECLLIPTGKHKSKAIHALF